jgi:type VI secretion system protein ImpG
LKHAAERRGERPYWFATRRPAGRSDRQIDHGTEVFLSLVDLAFQPSTPTDWTIGVETTCLNRDLPHHLPYGGDQPRLQFAEGAAAVSRLNCLTPPTQTFRPARKHGALWKLVSHLSLNHLSLVNGEGGADALREILKLYDFADSDETRSMIDGVLRVQHRRVVGRVTSDAISGFCRGVETRIELDEQRFVGSGLFLFASILERFLALYCSVNSFSKLIVTTKQREGELRRWTPRAGDRALL